MPPEKPSHPPLSPSLIRRNTAQELRTHLADLAAQLGLAKAFSNHEDLKHLLSQLQARLMEMSETQDRIPSSFIGEGDVTGLANCIQYFQPQDTIGDKKFLPAANHAGSHLYAAQISARKLSQFVNEMLDIDILNPHFKTFFTLLVTLLILLEKIEYSASKIEI